MATLGNRAPCEDNGCSRRSTAQAKKGRSRLHSRTRVRGHMTRETSSQIPLRLPCLLGLIIELILERGWPRWSSLRPHARGPPVPPVSRRRKWRALTPGQYARIGRPARESHGLRAGQPFFGVLRDLQQQRLELGARSFENVVLPQPTQDFAPGDAHALARGGDQPLVKVADQDFFHHVPGVIRAKQSLDVV